MHEPVRGPRRRKNGNEMAVLTIGNDRSANLLAQEIRNLFSKYFRNLSSKILGHESEVLARYALTFVMLSYVCF